MPKEIKYISVNQYGMQREFVHADHATEAKLIQGLTGAKTINQQVRDALTILSNNAITFTLVQN